MFCIWILYDAILLLWVLSPSLSIESSCALSLWAAVKSCPVKNVINICMFFTRYSLRYLSLKLYISSIRMLLSYKVYGIRYCSEIMFVLARGTTAILLWAKLLGCEKLNKRGFKLLKARANACNILGQQDATLLGPACCERLHTTLCVVACCCDLLEVVGWSLILVKL